MKIYGQVGDTSALRACGTFTLLTPRSKTPQLRLRRASETWLALRLNARQDIRHLRWRCDGGRLALMGRAVSAGCLRQPADAVYGGSGASALPRPFHGLRRPLPPCVASFGACGSCGPPACPRWPTSDCSAASLLRNRRRSQPLSAAADIPFQGNPRPLRPRRRSSCSFSRL